MPPFVPTVDGGWHAAEEERRRAAELLQEQQKKAAAQVAKRNAAEEAAKQREAVDTEKRRNAEAESLAARKAAEESKRREALDAKKRRKAEALQVERQAARKAEEAASRVAQQQAAILASVDAENKRRAEEQAATKAAAEQVAKQREYPELLTADEKRKRKKAAEETAKQPEKEAEMRRAQLVEERRQEELKRRKLQEQQRAEKRKATEQEFAEKCKAEARAVQAKQAAEKTQPDAVLQSVSLVGADGPSLASKLTVEAAPVDAPCDADFTEEVAILPDLSRYVQLGVQIAGYTPSDEQWQYIAHHSGTPLMLQVMRIKRSLCAFSSLSFAQGRGGTGKTFVLMRRALLLGQHTEGMTLWVTKNPKLVQTVKENFLVFLQVVIDPSHSLGLGRHSTLEDACSARRKTRTVVCCNRMCEPKTSFAACRITSRT